MGLSGKLLQIIALPGVIIIFAIVAAAAATTAIISKPGCPNKCGDVEIPFPFGFTEDCYLNNSFRLTCQNSTTPIMGDNIRVRNIAIEAHEIHVMNWVGRDCYQYDNSGSVSINKNKPWIWFSQYTISNSKNKFTVIGCDTYAYLSGYQNGELYTIGCSSQCRSLNNVVSGSCSGVGCCEVGFPDGLKNITVEVKSFQNHSEVWKFNPCGHALVVEKDEFNFSTSYLKNYPNETVPLVLDWAVGTQTCDIAQKEQNLACKENSECLDRQTKQARGYRCKCKQGYKGNPYLQGQGGCLDIDECLDPTLNNCTRQCTNGIGTYTCGCPKWYRGDGRKDGEGCSVDLAHAFKVSIGIGIGLIAMLGGCLWLFLVFRQRKIIKDKKELFQQNGGLILEQCLHDLGATQKARIFTVKELKKATKNYDKSMIIGPGSSGTIYKGILPNNTSVAIKKSKAMDSNQVRQFIKDIVQFSRINHNNVVKLLGCCLETQNPLLVYEFVSQDTLFNYIHHDRDSNTSTKRWETYLRIVTDSADALSYLHSLCVIHRDVKPSNILLDDTFTAKVSDFEISKLVPHDQKDVANVVQGTLGYLDLEYLRTNQLTEKSDVYSFAVVLVEILTGKDVFSFDRSEDERCLPMYFLSFLDKEDRMDEILDKRIVEEGNKEQINKVVKLAEMCLRVKGDERPNMKEVAMKLELIRKMETHS